MDHYELADWVDFVQGDAVGDQVLAMRRHRTEGCERCQELYRLAQELTEVAAGSRGRSPRFPEHVLWAAQAIFSAAGGGPALGLGVSETRGRAGPGGSPGGPGRRALQRLSRCLAGVVSCRGYRRRSEDGP